MPCCALDGQTGGTGCARRETVGLKESPDMNMTKDDGTPPEQAPQDGRSMRLAAIREEIRRAIGDPRPSIPAEEVFARLEALYTADRGEAGR